MPKKTKDIPIPADLLAMTIEQLDAETARHDTGDIRDERNALAEQRDNAQAELERLSQRRYDINRAIIAKLESMKKK